MGDSYTATLEVWPWPDAEKDALEGTVFAPLLAALEDRGADFSTLATEEFSGYALEILDDHRGRFLRFQTELNGGTLGFREGSAWYDRDENDKLVCRYHPSVLDRIEEIPWLAYTVWDEGAFGWTGEEFTWWPCMRTWPEKSKLVRLYGAPFSRVLDGSGGVVLNQWTYQQARDTLRGRALQQALELYFLFDPRSYVPPPGTPTKLGEIPMLGVPIEA